MNAFLAAGRSVTLVLQKSMASVCGFESWYSEKQTRMAGDDAMRFFLELRNVSLHQGPVGYIGGATLRSPRWTYRFAGNKAPVPPTLLGKDVAVACAEHLQKIASVVGEFSKDFPYSYCIIRALTPDGMRALGYSLDDVGRLLGLPIGYLDVGQQIPIDDKLRILRKEFDPVDLESINRMQAGDFVADGKPMTFNDVTGTDLVDEIAAGVETANHPNDGIRTLFIDAFSKHTKKR